VLVPEPQGWPRGGETEAPGPRVPEVALGEARPPLRIHDSVSAGGAPGRRDFRAVVSTCVGFALKAPRRRPLDLDLRHQRKLYVAAQPDGSGGVTHRW